MKLTIALAVLTLGVSAAWGQAPANISRALDQESKLNDQCQGKSGDLQATHQACADRDAFDAKLKAAGMCYGRPGEAGYLREWQPCDQTAQMAGLSWTVTFANGQPIAVAVTESREGIFRAMVVENLPPSDVVSAPKSEQLEVEGRCAERIYSIMSVAHFSDELRSGSLTDILPVEPLDRRVIEGTDMERVFSLACAES